MTINSRLTKRFMIYLLWGLLLTACATQRLNLEDYRNPNLPDPTSKMFKNLTFDKTGLPVFSEILEKRPSGKGEQFYLVDYDSPERPLRTFQIALIRGEKASVMSPLQIIFEWTGSGIVVGLNSVLRSDLATKTPEDLLVVMTVPVITTVGGFIAGVVASIPEINTQVNRIFITKKEILVSYTTYEYDDQNRLVSMKAQSPTQDSKEVSATTKFFYDGDSAEPTKAEVTSVPENKTRVIE